MPRQPDTPAVNGAFNADSRGIHYDFLKSGVPAWFTQAITQRQEELARHEMQMPSWYLSATAQKKSDLAVSHTRYRETLNQVENTLGDIQDVLVFAEAPLKQAIKKTFGLDLDVHAVFFVRKYALKGRDGWGSALAFEQPSGLATRHEYRGTSLLEAALANFTAEEEEINACADCEIITTWNPNIGSIIADYDAVSAQAVAIAPHEFARMCRTLDLGRLYQEHIQAVVQPTNVAVRTALHTQLQEHQRQLLALSAEFASLKPAWGGISAPAFRMIKQVISTPATATLEGKPITYAALSIFGCELVGPLLIGPDRIDSRTPERLVVYIPHDPQQALKEYTNGAEFMIDLRARLHSASYRRFFSRFVPQREQGRFFQQFNKRYKPSNGNGAAGDYPLASDAAKLSLEARTISASTLWVSLRETQVRKILFDARAVAVPTADEDRQARMDRLESYLDAVVSVFNLAAFVVPGLGPVMLAVGAVQMCNEVFDGLEAYEQGDVRTMWAHFSSVALNVAFAAAGASVLPEIKLGSALDELQPVTLTSGKQRLWKPDLSTYEHTQPIPPGVAADELGLHVFDDKTILRLNGKRYRVQKDPVSGEYRIVHPSRADAYQPRLTQNGSGLWNHELERPLTWEGAPLMRRLGPMTEGFSDAELEQVRQVADVSEDVLRRVHVEGKQAPGILLDTLRQFRAYRDAVKVAEGIRQGALDSELCGYAASLAVKLPGWPASKAIEAFSGNDLSGPSIKYGNSRALPSDTLRIHRADLMNGQLPKRVAETLSERQLRDLVGGYPRTLQEQSEAVQVQLEQAAVRARRQLSDSLYMQQQPASTPAIALLQRDFSRLSTRMAQELLADATPAELEVMNTGRRIPLRLAEKARLAQQQLRLTQAYEGLYLDALAGPDTEALVLNTLPRLPGWTDNLRLEVREYTLTGKLRASYGAEEAAERKVLVWSDDGRYQATNLRGEALGSLDDLYGAIQHALTDSHREALGLPHAEQGAELKATLIAHALPREQLVKVLKMQPRTRPVFTGPRRTSGGRLGYPLSGGGGRALGRRALEERIRTLYPESTQEQVEAFISQHGPEASNALRALEREYKQLSDTLQDWQQIPEQVTDAEQASTGFVARIAARRNITRALTQAWRHVGASDLAVDGAYQGQVLDLANVNLRDQLAQLPELTANFGHVSSVDLSSAGLEGGIDRFLSYFKRLQRLNLSDNELIALPGTIGQLTRLTELDLSDNLVKLDAPAVQNLRGLTRLNFLALESNHLGLSPDISQMPHLNILLLGDTELTAWPTGVFDLPRASTFHLNLSANALEQIPVVAPGSAEALIVARTEISQGPEYISPQNLQIFRDYRISVGMDPYRLAPPRGVQESIYWREGLSQEQWFAKQGVWDSLENEHGAEPFFVELRKLSESADAIDASAAVKAELTGKVWQMIEAAVADSKLRDRLFKMATAPTTCVDAGAQLFNAMGLEVLIFQAYQLGAEDLVERELLMLARGKSRLDELGRIARGRISELQAEGRTFPEYDEYGALITRYDAEGHPIKYIDEVEIHLIYPTNLAERLDLPWQSRKMKFSEPDVTPAMIDDAYARVLALEDGSLLDQRISEQPFWDIYVRHSNPKAFDGLRVRVESLLDSLEALEPISQAEYDSDMALIAGEEKTLLLNLTQQALKRACLERIETAQVP
ncbi:DUF6543 domain-containing protein [Pseudomonas trivialis]|uniref:dermonecrotic toxin domain-containing protein n=1 Tax=Pseudomonas trivialis TaxID=200450 RepID=UPI0030D29769